MTQSNLLQVARTYHQTGRLAAAEAIYRRIVAETPTLKAIAFHALGVIAFQQGRHQVAADQIAKAIDADGSRPEFHVDLSHALQHLLQAAGAIAAIERAVALGERSASLLSRLFALYLDEDRPDDAIALVARMDADAAVDADPMERCERGRMRRIIGDVAGASHDLLVALAHQPATSMAWHQLGLVARSSGDNSRAVLCYARAAACAEPDPDLTFDRGLALQALRRIEEARACFREVSFVKTYTMCYGADIELDLGDLDVGPDRAEPVRQRGLEAERSGRDIEAVALFALSASLVPKDGRNRQDLDRTLARLGKRRVKFALLYHPSMMIATEPDMFMRRVQLGQIPDDLLVVFLSGTRPANRTLIAMWRRQLPLLVDDHLYYSMQEALLPGLRTTESLIWKNLYENYAHPASHGVLSFTPEEMERGRAGLRRLGVDPDKDWFVCAFARDLGWSKRLFSGLTDTYTPFRNADINSYRLAMRHIVDQGGTVVRIGAGAEQPLDMAHPRGIDYAMTAREDFMDIFLVAHCRFVMGTPAGISDCGKLFDRPCLFVNSVSIGHCPPGKQALHVPKRLVRTATGEPVPIDEYLGHFRDAADPVAEVFTDGGLARNGYTYVDNTPEEILEAAKEMIDLIEGRWGKDPADQDLLERYFALFGGIRHPQVGSSARVRQPMALSHLRRYRSWYFPGS
ncbi:MAG: TIGR04372 family glycosyltransferase [Alphaproteobacteria bacterium]|nr:TIGR04372 family glycosyltransferase [Alphaproteobacteria bacterium]